MANMIPAGSKRPRDPSAQGLKVKFLINIPMKVESVDQAQRRCKYLLDALSEGFKKENKKFMNDKNDKKVEDAAVIFGLNGKHTSKLAEDLKKLQNFTYDYEHTDIKYKIITYTWGKDGEIAKDVPEGTVPYQDIREHLKNHRDTEDLVKQLRGKDPRCLIYFSFVDSDTVKFNYIYSEYLQIVREELEKDSIPPTVMSTGYELTHDSDHYPASRLDREVRAAVAEVHPLLVYYPEPNFCVLVRDGLNTIEESFINKKKNEQKYSMESPVLIRQVKKRDNFKAVFPIKNPIIIETPERFKLSGEGLMTNQSHLIGMNLAKGATCNGVLTNAQTYTKGDGPNTCNPKLAQGVAGINRGFIIDLFNCEDDKKFEELCKKNPYTMDGKVATALADAVKEARKYKKFIIEFDKKLPEDKK
nr:uncharacterized protein LOC111856981 [Paramormyrops kingsleyae]XP_023693133.1 uncharacterized protein LOC111856981 [Paramormyrops kingsleyae]